MQTQQYSFEEVKQFVNSIGFELYRFKIGQNKYKYKLVSTGGYRDYPSLVSLVNSISSIYNIKYSKNRKKKRVSMYFPHEVDVINKTVRNSGAVGKSAIVPRIVKTLISKDDIILDFGAGSNAQHALNLISEGYRVVSYEFGKNYNPSIHNNHALNYKYTVVYASNVLNVQYTEDQIVELIHLWSQLLYPGGHLVANYPIKPRNSSLNERDIDYLMRKFFHYVRELKGYSSPVWLCTK